VSHRAAAAALAVLALSAMAPLRAQAPRPLLPTPADVAPRGYLCPRASPAPAIDGRLDDPAWSRASWTDDFVDIEGPARPRPALRTRARMLWDDRYLYVGAEIEEPHVWATLTEHDSVIFRDDDFEVFIDPDGDGHEYYEFEINALGTGWDLLLPRPYKDGGRAVDRWEIPGLKSAVHVEGTINDSRDTDRGWTVELAFPWAVLGELARRPAPPSDGDQWRVNFSRVDWPMQVRQGAYVKPEGAKEDNWVWSPQGVVDMHRPEAWGYVQFSASAATATFAPDASLPARRWLSQVYYAQRERRRTQGAFARALDDLPLPPLAPGLRDPRLETTRDLYQASIEIAPAGGAPRRWNIRQDALVWPD
jgi:hypothetical protein